MRLLTVLGVAMPGVRVAVAVALTSTLLAAAMAAPSYALSTPGLDVLADPSAPPSSAEVPAAAPAADSGHQAPDDTPVTRSAGHLDLLAPQLIDGVLVMTARDDTEAGGAVYRTPEAMSLVVPDAARQQIPEGFDMLGEPGEDVWLLPQTQDPDLLWPGWSTEHPSLGEGMAGDVTFMLRAVDGPGRFVLYQTVGFGQTRVIASTTDGVPDEWAEPIPAHVHANWAFGTPGTYTLTAIATGTLADGTPVQTAPADFTFTVEGDAPDAPADTGAGDPTAGDTAAAPPSTGTDAPTSVAQTSTTTTTPAQALPATGPATPLTATMALLLMAVSAASLRFLRAGPAHGSDLR